MTEFKIRRADGDDDLHLIERLAGEIWRECYEDILSREQIEYMCATVQSYAHISRMVREGVTYYIAYAAGGVAAGYCAVDMSDGDMFLSKLYVHKDFRGNGLARAFIERAVGDCENAYRISLTVSKRSAAAIGAYTKMGFAMYGTETAYIGGGFVTDDFYMRKVLDTDKQNAAAVETLRKIISGTGCYEKTTTWAIPISCKAKNE